MLTVCAKIKKPPTLQSNRQRCLMENENNRVMSVACVTRLLFNSGLRVFISSKQVREARFSCALGALAEFLS
jgi:hypothetical protein